MPRKMAIVLASIFLLAGAAFLADAAKNFYLQDFPIAVDSLVWGAGTLFACYFLYVAHIKK